MPLASAARMPPEPGADAVDFSVSSSLPPMVAGPIRGELELSVPCLYAKPGVLCPTRYLRDRQSQPMFAVRMIWWGDSSGPGTVLKPNLLSGRDEGGEMARRARPSKATCALFPVRCGLDGLVAYLKDMVRANDKLNDYSVRIQHNQCPYRCPLERQALWSPTTRQTRDREMHIANTSR